MDFKQAPSPRAAFSFLRRAGMLAVLTSCLMLTGCPQKTGGTAASDKDKQAHQQMANSPNGAASVTAVEPAK